MPRASDEEMIQKIKNQQAKLTARLQRIQARRSQAFRKKDARGKILIGGAILAALKKQDVTEAGVMKILRTYLPQTRDQALLQELYGFPFQVTEEATEEQAPTQQPHT